MNAFGLLPAPCRDEPEHDRRSPGNSSEHFARYEILLLVQEGQFARVALLREIGPVFLWLICAHYFAWARTDFLPSKWLLPRKEGCYAAPVKAQSVPACSSSTSASWRLRPHMNNIAQGE